MHEEITEQRFQAVIRSLCERWKSFDFHRQFRSKDSSLLVEPHLNRVGSVAGLADSLIQDLESIGAVAAIKLRLQTGSDADALLDLAASNRFDLSIEFLVLCSAWRSLFGETERRAAAERLLSILALWFSDGTPSVADDLDRIVDWLMDKIVRYEVDRDLPKSSLNGRHDSSRNEQSWCDSVADTAREFSETGLIRTSLIQCDHYLHCERCLGTFPELEKQLRHFEDTSITRCRELLKLLRICMDRVLSEVKRRQAREEFAWRAIVCGAGLTYNDSISEFSHALSEVESRSPLVPDLQRLLSKLDRDEIYLLSFAEVASFVFIETQWGLYENDELVYLPSDGDLSDVSGALVVLNEPNIDKWKQLMTGSDLEFARRDREGGRLTVPFDADGLFMVLFNAAAARRGDKHFRRLRSVGELRELENEKPRPLGDAAVSDSRVTLSQGDSITTLIDRMKELHELVVSNSAAQAPILGTLQSVLKKIDGPSRLGAEESLRRELGEVLYEKLSPTVRACAIDAEYLWLDANTSPSLIVLTLAKAFEIQLRETTFEPFCDTLLARGIRNYPEQPGPPLPRIGESSSVQPNSGLPLRPVDPSDRPLRPLLKNGYVQDRTLGELQKLLERPRAILTEFLAKQKIQVQALLDVLPEITRLRNRVAHPAYPMLREEAEHIRRRWLGKAAGFPNIFSLLITDSDERAPGARP